MKNIQINNNYKKLSEIHFSFDIISMKILNEKRNEYSIHVFMVKKKTPIENYFQSVDLAQRFENYRMLTLVT